MRGAFSRYPEMGVFSLLRMTEFVFSRPVSGDGRGRTCLLVYFEGGVVYGPGNRGDALLNGGVVVVLCEARGRVNKEH